MLRLPIRRRLRDCFEHHLVEGPSWDPRFLQDNIPWRSGLSETAPHENPLVPNKKLRQLYTAIVEARLLDEHIAALYKGAKARRRLDSTRGQEACRVSTAIELKPGDLVCDAQVNAIMALLFGTKLGAISGQVHELASGARERWIPFGDESTRRRQLPWIEDANDRLKMAMGAALAFKTLKQSNIVVAYVVPSEISKEVWRQLLVAAAKLELPIIFVVLPGVKAKREIDRCALAREAGVPGIPVDANDAVALYRVSQESIGRTRGGDGPVLIECIAGTSARQKPDETNDPVLHTKSFLIGRKVCTEAWANRAGEAFRKKLAAYS